MTSTGSIIGNYVIGNRSTVNPSAIAIDKDGNLWITNFSGNYVIKLSPTGSIIGKYTVGNGALSIAIDTSGNVRVVNSMDYTVTELTSTGSLIGTYPVGPWPSGIAMGITLPAQILEPVSFLLYKHRDMGKEGYITAVDGTRLFYRCLLADEPQASVFILHGLGEHLGRYGNVTGALKDYDLFLLDLRGHGKSGGKRGHVMRFDEYLDDVDALRKEARPMVKGRSFLLGHSMGGLIALRYALYRPGGLSGVVASGPLLGVNVKVPRIKDAIGRLVANLVPGLSMNNEIDTSMLSHDRAVVEAYNVDPLVHAKVSARWYVEMMKAMEDTNAGAPRLTLPCLIMHGRDDALTSPQASRQFYERAGSKDKTYRSYEGSYHEVFNEIDKQKPLSDVREWLRTHTRTTG